MAGTSHTYDANGNLTGDGTNAYIYDGENRLVSATNSGVTTTLTYDPLGRLWQVVKGAANTRFLYDADALIGEYDASGLLANRYVHGSDVKSDDPLIWYVGSGTGTKRYLHADHDDSIVAATNAGGAPSINTYDEYGVPGASNTGRFQYTGQAYIPELSLYYYKARMYSAQLGRFLQVDQIGYEGGLNLYAYVGDDPVNANDPPGTGPGDACFFSPSQCGAREMTEEEKDHAEEVAKQVGLFYLSLLPAERVGLGLGWMGRALGISRLARPTFAQAKALVSARYLAGEATKGRTRQFIGEGGRKEAERLFRGLTGSGRKALDPEKTVVGALGDGSKVNIRTETLSNGTQRTTVEIQREAVTGTRIPERIKVRFDDEHK